MEPTVVNVLVTVLLVYALSRVQKLYNGIRDTGNLPGFRFPFYPYGLLGGVCKTSWWNMGTEGVWRWRHTMYKNFGNDTISIVPFIAGKPTVITANLEVAKQITGAFGKSAFGKLDIEDSGALKYWGPSMFLTDGDVWRKHRRIIGPAFSQNLYELIWSHSLDLYAQMLTVENPTNESTFTLTRVQKVTFNFAFCIIGRCGFDFPFHWSSEMDGREQGEKRNDFALAMRFVVDHIKLLLLSDSVRRLPFSTFKKMNESISTIRQFMESKIAEKEIQVATNKHSMGNDIFSMLVQANQAEEEAKLKLNYDELISNVFLMLFAGHETTAHTLAATIACLARYPEQQQEVFDQIAEVVEDREPTINDYTQLTKVQSAFYEALRMFPTSYIMIREAKEDTILHVPVSLDSDECTPLPVKKGTKIVTDMVGIHHNSRYFNEPNVYKISRWEGISNESEAMPGFGIGPRACIGRKFALTEAVCFLTLLVRDYKLEPLLSKGETVEEWFEGVRRCTAIVTLGVADVAVRFVKR